MYPKLINDCISCVGWYFTPSPECGLAYGIGCGCYICGAFICDYIKEEKLNDWSKSKRCFKDCSRCCDENYFNTFCLCNDYSDTFRPRPHSCCCSQSLKEDYINRKTNKGFLTRTPIKACWNQTTCYMCGTHYEPPKEYKFILELDPNYYNEPNFYYEGYKNCLRCCDENYYSPCFGCSTCCCCYQKLKEDNAIVKNNKVYVYSTPIKYYWNKMTCYICGTPYKVSDPQKYKDLIEPKYKDLTKTELIENHKKNGCNWDDIPINNIKKDEILKNVDDDVDTDGENDGCNWDDIPKVIYMPERNEKNKDDDKSNKI